MKTTGTDAPGVYGSLPLYAATGMAEPITLYCADASRRESLAARVAALGFSVGVAADMRAACGLSSGAILLADDSADLRDELRAARIAGQGTLPVLILAGATLLPLPSDLAGCAIPISAEPGDSELRTALDAAVQLALRERRFRSLMQASPVGMIEVDAKGDCLFCNDRWTELGGQRRAASLGAGWAAAIHPEDRTAVLDAWRNAAMAGLAFERETRLQRPDGIVIWVRFQALPLLADGDGDGALRGHVATIADVSARKGAETQLAATVAQLRAVFNLFNDAIFLCDVADLKVYGANRLAAKMFGYSPEELLNVTLGQLTAGIPPHTEDAALEWARQTRDGVGPELQEWRVRDRDGHLFWVEVSVRRAGTDGDALLVIIARDISERCSAMEAVRASEERFRLLYENSPVGISMAWLDALHLFDANAAYCRMLGYTVEELRQKTLMELTHPDDRAALAARLFDLVAGRVHQLAYEKRYLHKDGHVVWVSAIVTAVRNREGKVLYGLGITADITERREAERLRLDEQELQRDALVREVHHRIKNNLQGVVSLIEQLKRKHPQAVGALEEAAGQIDAIAVVHGLQGSTFAAEVRPHQLVQAIVASAARLTGTAIAFHESGNDWAGTLNSRDTVAVALIVNELVYNAVKHGAANTACSIEVVTGASAGGFDIRVRNRPARLPPDFDFPAKKGLGTGLTLVTTLLPRRGARLTFAHVDDGVEAHLRLTHPCADMAPAAPRPKEG